MAKDAKWYAGLVRNAYAQTTEEKLINLETAEFIEHLAAELEAVKRERDALKHDFLSLACEGFSSCYFCAHFKPDEAPCKHTLEIGAEDIGDCFEWRGVKETEV